MDPMSEGTLITASADELAIVKKAYVMCE